MAYRISQTKEKPKLPKVQIPSLNGRIGVSLVFFGKEVFIGVVISGSKKVTTLETAVFKPEPSTEKGKLRVLEL